MLGSFLKIIFEVAFSPGMKPRSGVSAWERRVEFLSKSTVLTNTERVSLRETLQGFHKKEEEERENFSMAITQVKLLLLLLDFESLGIWLLTAANWNIQAERPGGCEFVLPRISNLDFAFLFRVF